MKGKHIQHSHREDHQTFQKFYQWGRLQSDIDVSRSCLWNWQPFSYSQAGLKVSQIVPEGSSETDNSRALNNIVKV